MTKPIPLGASLPQSPRWDRRRDCGRPRPPRSDANLFKPEGMTPVAEGGDMFGITPVWREIVCQPSSPLISSFCKRDD